MQHKMAAHWGRRTYPTYQHEFIKLYDGRLTDGNAAIDNVKTRFQNKMEAHHK